MNTTKIECTIAIVNPRRITGVEHPELSESMALTGRARLSLEVPFAPAEAVPVLQDLLQAQLDSLLKCALESMEADVPELQKYVDSTFVPPAPAPESAPEAKPAEDKQG